MKTSACIHRSRTRCGCIDREHHTVSDNRQTSYYTCYSVSLRDPSIRADIPAHATPSGSVGCRGRYTQPSCWVPTRWCSEYCRGVCDVEWQVHRRSVHTLACGIYNCGTGRCETHRFQSAVVEANDVVSRLSSQSRPCRCGCLRRSARCDGWCEICLGCSDTYHQTAHGIQNTLVLSQVSCKCVYTQMSPQRMRLWSCQNSVFAC